MPVKYFYLWCRFIMRGHWVRQWLAWLPQSQRVEGLIPGQAFLCEVWTFSPCSLRTFSPVSSHSSKASGWGETLKCSLCKAWASVIGWDAEGQVTGNSFWHLISNQIFGTNNTGFTPVWIMSSQNSDGKQMTLEVTRVLVCGERVRIVKVWCVSVHNLGRFAVLDLASRCWFTIVDASGKRARKRAWRTEAERRCLVAPAGWVSCFRLT